MRLLAYIATLVAITISSVSHAQGITDPAVFPRRFTPSLPLPTICNASTYSELASCIEQASEKSPQVPLVIKLTAPIVLEPRQVIRFKGIQNVTLQGQGLATTISETADRMMDAAENNDSHHLIEIVGASKQIVLSNLAFRDAAGEESFLDEKCRINVNNPNPNLWDTHYCFAPILLGSKADKSEDYTRHLTLDHLDVLTRKAILMEIRKTADLIVSDSLFDGGKVFGVLLKAFYPHVSSIFRGNRFQHSGTAALTLFDSFNSLILANKFTDNHIDPQYGFCEGGGTVPSCTGGTLKFYPGGQLYLAEVGMIHKEEILPENSNHFVRVIGNEISMTPEYLGHRSTAGIEIMKGAAGELTDVVVENNFIHDISGEAISVHNDRLGASRQKRISIRNNRLYNNLRDYRGASKVKYIQMEVGPYFGSHLHPNVDLESNHLEEEGGVELVGSFSGTPGTCTLPVNKHVCQIDLQWSAQGFPADSKPTIRVNGRIMAKYSAKSNSGTITIPWINLKNANFTLHVDDVDPNPVAAINVVGVAP